MKAKQLLRSVKDGLGLLVEKQNVNFSCLLKLTFVERYMRRNSRKTVFTSVSSTIAAKWLLLTLSRDAWVPIVSCKGRSTTWMLSYGTREFLVISAMQLVEAKWSGFAQNTSETWQHRPSDLIVIAQNNHDPALGYGERSKWVKRSSEAPQIRDNIGLVP